MRQALLVLGAALGMGCGFASLFYSTLPVFLKPLGLEFGWSRGQTSAITALTMLGMALGAPLIGRTIDRFGPARVIAASVLLMAGLVAGLSRLPNHPALLAALCFTIGFAGVGTAPPGYLSVLARAFDGRLGLALGTAMVGLGVGTVGMPMLAQKLISLHGWREAYVGLAALSLGVASLAFLLLFTGPTESRSARRKDVGESTSDLPGNTLRQALGATRFWMLALILLAVSTAVLGAGMHLASLLTDRGVEPAVAARSVALAGLGVALGRLVTGALLDMVSAPRLGAASFALGGIGLGLLAAPGSSSMWITSLGAVLAGFAIGAEGDFLPFAVRRYFGLRSFGAVFGVLFGMYALGGMVGPIAYGLAFDRFGDFGIAYLVGAIACLACAAATWWLGPYRFHHTGR